MVIMTKTLASLKAYKINKLNCSMIVSLKFAFIMKPTYYQSSFLPLISLKKKQRNQILIELLIYN